MVKSVVFLCLLAVGVSVDASSNNTERENNATTGFAVLLEPVFWYGVAAGAGLMLLIVLLILLVIYCCVKKGRGKKAVKKTVTKDYGPSARLLSVNYSHTEDAIQPLCANKDEVNEEESEHVSLTPIEPHDNRENQEENENDYLTPVEAQGIRENVMQRECKEIAKQNESRDDDIYENDDRGEERSLLSNATGLQRAANAASDQETDGEGDDSDREYSTPFDKRVVPLDLQKKRYEGLDRLYENCVEQRCYMNLNPKNNEDYGPSGTETGAKDGASPSSPGYLNVPKRSPLISRSNSEAQSPQFP